MPSTSAAEGAESSSTSWPWPSLFSIPKSINSYRDNKYYSPFSSSRTTKCDATTPAPPVLAPLPSSSKPPTTEPQSPPPLEAEQQEPRSESLFPNPGSYEQCPMEIKRLVMLDTFDGFRCEINKQLSPFMLAAHSFWLGTTMLPDGRTKNYTFVTQVANESGLLMTRVDPEKGSLDGRVHASLGPAALKLQMNVSADGQQDQLMADVDLTGETWTGNLKYGTMGGGVLLGCNYFQSVTPHLAMGGEGMYIASNQSLLSSYMLKYTTKPPSESPTPDSPQSTTASSTTPSHSTVIANFNTAQGMLTLNYKRLVTPPSRVTLGAELQCSPFTLDSQVMFGAEFQFTRSKMNVCVDGTGRVQALLEAKLGATPGSPSLNFSADMDHGKDAMKFGYGITVGS